MAAQGPAAPSRGTWHDRAVLSMSLITESPTSPTSAPDPGDSSGHPNDTASAIAQVLCGIADELADRPSLRPSAEVNGLFGRLVRTVLDTPDHLAPAVLSHVGVRERRSRLLDLSARGEGELELAWATRVCVGKDPRAELALFPYADNYRRLVRMETGVLTSALAGPLRSVAVVGSGPLPLSALLLAGPDVVVEGLDHDARAVDLSRRVADAIGTPGIRFHHVDAADADLSGYQVVVLAALVGASPVDKAEIVGRMRASMDGGAILLVRSARGLRTLLYPPVDPATLTGFDVLATVHPVNDIVNSVVLARSREDG